MQTISRVCCRRAPPKPQDGSGPCFLEPKKESQAKPARKAKPGPVAEGFLLKPAASNEAARPERPATLRKGRCCGCWSARGTLECQQCHRVTYCSRDCQREHWAVHKQYCGKKDVDLRNRWRIMRQDLVGAEGDLSSHRHFMQNVGPKFLYSHHDWTALHALVLLIGVLQKFPKRRDEFEQLLQEVVDMGVDVNAQDDSKYTALHLACKDGSDEACLCATFLLTQPNIDLDLKNNENKTVHYCCATDEVRELVTEMQKILDKAQAQIVSDKWESKKRLEKIQQQKEEELAKIPRRDRCRQCWKAGRLICRRCNNVKYCSEQCQKSNWEVHREFCGKTPHDLGGVFGDKGAEAVEKKSFAGLRTFLQHAPGDLRVDLATGWWVSHAVATMAMAMELGSREQLQAFGDLLQDCVDFGVDLNAQCKQGSTALHMLCERDDGKGQFAAIWLLRNAALDLDKRNAQGKTARALCSDARLLEIFKELEEEAAALRQRTAQS